MYRLSIKNLLLLAAILFCGLSFSGCAALVSPYNSKFECPNENPGKCVSVETAYNDSVGNPLVRSDAPPCPCEKGKNKVQAPAPAPVAPGAKSVYKNAMYRRLASLINQPTPPIVAPPRVMRVLILSYTGKGNEMFGYRYIYFFATHPKWIYSTATDGD